MSAYYSSREIFLRMVWSVVYPIFFRYSPRLLYGWRNMILRLMGASIGKNVQIFPSACVTFPWLLKVGDHAVISWRVRIYNLGETSIGAYTVISQNCHLCGGDHDYQSREFTLLRKGLIIGDHVWIAADAFIGPGIIVNNGALIAARSVVVKDVPEKSLVAGNPAKIIKTLEANARW